MNVVDGSLVGHHPFRKRKKKKDKEVHHVEVSQPIQTKDKPDKSAAECF